MCIESEAHGEKCAPTRVSRWLYREETAAKMLPSTSYVRYRTGRGKSVVEKSVVISGGRGLNINSVRRAI